jgi:hypothetical protein
LSYCWDLESNNRKRIPFTVKLVRDTKQGPKALTDERDIYELIQNYGQRRVRACIQAMIPVDIIEDAKAKVRETIEKGEEKFLYFRYSRQDNAAGSDGSRHERKGNE